LRVPAEGQERYSRQVRFSPIGAAGQDRIRSARAAVIGVGALVAVSVSELVANSPAYREKIQALIDRALDGAYAIQALARKPQAVRQVLPDLLRDLGAPFPAVWEHFQAAHPPREAARLFAKVLGQIETHGVDRVVPALETALATGTPILLALTPGGQAMPPLDREVVPAPLRELEVLSGCAADYDRWLAEAV